MPFLKIQNAVSIMCVHGSDVIGSLLLTTEWSDWRNGTVWWLHSLYFKSEYRGRGLFSKMYSYVRVDENILE